MASKTLVIVESPTKARTITKFLGKDYIVKASMGHIRDLPNKASEIPANIKKEPWTRLGVNIANDFEALYIIPPNKKDNVKALKDALKDADFLFLATDEDREGESISWHLMETLNPKVPTKRLVFHEITKEAIQNAIQSAREIDANLVRAQETRRIIDRLYGYEVSPILWKKIAPSLSAGRVQSVTCRLLVDLERKRMRFMRVQYWGLQAKLATSKGEQFEAELVIVGDKRMAVGKDFHPETGKLIDAGKVAALSQADAEKLQAKLQNTAFSVEAVDEKPFTNRPAAPFVTSTLQQEANRKLRYSAKRTMTVAQQLYENGFITYMRTDSTTLSTEALNAARSLILNEFGQDFLYPQPRIYTTKVKNAQEAHEAIRPAGETFTPMAVVRDKLGEDASKLYEMIWKRTVASQMADAKGTHISVQVRADDSIFRASGKTISFAGFLRAYVEGSDDPEADIADQERILPPLKKSDALKATELKTSEHTTQPPARYTEGSLIKELEQLGIGRPSTWATVVDTVLSRGYAFKKGTALVPTYTAFGVVQLMERHFAKLLDYEFTARLEDDLDAISRGEAGNLEYLKSFYFGKPNDAGLKDLVSKGQDDIDPRTVCGIPLGKAADGVDVEVRVGRYGPFINKDGQRASVPQDLPPDELTLERAQEILAIAAKGPESLGNDPVTGQKVYLKIGRFGPYIQLGEGGEEVKPKMASLLPGMLPEDVKLETALKLLEFPKTLGMHPETNLEVIAANGRYGPYVKSGVETRSIPTDDFPLLDLTLEQAIEILKMPKRRGRQAGAQPKSLRELGAHPTSGKPLLIKSGRYGPYVTDGEINASLRRDMTVEAVTMEQAVDLLNARADKIAEGGGKPKRKPKAKAAAKPKAAAKKKKKAE